MLLRELHEYYGTWTELTRKLELGYSTYRGWLKNDSIPYLMQLLIEKKTEGRFLADINHVKPKK